MMALKFLSAGGSGSTSGAIAAIDYAVLMGATLTSNSWGLSTFSQALHDAIAAAEAQGQLFVAAAGNDNTDIDASPSYPASYDSAAIIAVAAIDSYGARYYSSNYGQATVHVGAPGSDIYSLWSGGGYAWMSGTSMACPHVAGAASLLWSRFPSLSADDIKQSILLSATPSAALEGKCTTGGVLNLYGALLEAMGRTWIQVEPRSAVLQPNETMELNVTLQARMAECGLCEV
jgi:subtilisin family serine protease